MSEHSSFPLRAETVILCESVRLELHGKYSILGAFAGDIIVTSLPGHIAASLYLELYSKISGQVSLAIELTYNGDQVARGELLIDFTDIDKPSVIAFPTFPILIEKPGFIRVYLEYNGARRQILKKEVELGDLPQPSVSTASQPPSSQSLIVAPAKASRRAKRRPSAPPSGGEP